jgi:hypothetical protein
MIRFPTTTQFPSGLLRNAGNRWISRAEAAAYLRDQRAVGCIGRQALNVARAQQLVTSPKPDRDNLPSYMACLRAGRK